MDGSKTFEIKMTLESSAIGIRHCIEGKIALE
ncbi:MAG: DUF6494 family protein [Methylococcales bacterium]|nr:DUF6494 family protein [Methylococcales bacterium]